MKNFDLANLAVQMICPNNLVKVDDTGYPSVLVYIPAFKNSEVLVNGDNNLHPAFIVNGEAIPGFYYSKYQNVEYDGVAYSLPDKEPALSPGTVNNVSVYCEAKGAGWHLSTAAEWAAIALWCKKNGFLPYGNNDYRKDKRETNYKARPAFVSGGELSSRTATGTGPVTWSHDNTVAGIWDMNGNVWERQGGIRLVWGELQVLANNDAADSKNSQDMRSTCWKAINAATGALVEPEDWPDNGEIITTGNTVRIDYKDGKWCYSKNITISAHSVANCDFGSLYCDATISEAAKMVLRALALLPDEDDTDNKQIVTMGNTYGMMYMLRGGDYTTQSSAGINAMKFVNGMNNEYVDLGFRSAYIPELDK